MKIEDINKASLGTAEDNELYNLRLRVIQLYEKNFLGNTRKAAMGLRRGELIEKYRGLREEMKRRKLRVWKESAIDRVAFKKAMMGIDVPSLGDMVIVHNFAVITGPFIRSPKTANEMDVVIREEPHKKDERIESLIQSVLMMATEKTTRFTYKQLGADGAHIPLFDIVLRPKNETKRVSRSWPYDAEASMRKEKGKKEIQISKPEETENTIRIPVGDGCEVTATITIDADQGIKALYCGRVKKIRTYLFDKKKKAWTMATARAWIKEHKEKITKSLSETDEIEDGGIIETEYDLTISKDETEKATVFKIFKLNKKLQIAGGVVYEPDVVDSQGDQASAEEIQKAMYRFMETYATQSNRIRVMHKGKKLFFPIIEVFQPEQDIKKGGKIVKAGSWWMMIKIKNKAIWDQIEDGTISGFSMGGVARS